MGSQEGWQVAHQAPSHIIQASKAAGMQVNIDGKEFVAYTPYNPSNVNPHQMNLNRATVVAKKVKDEFIFGISLCSEEDNFNKAMGRKLARERLAQGKWRMDCTEYRRMGETWEQGIIRFVHELALRANWKSEKFKRKICRHCKEKG